MDQFTYAERATDWRGNNNIAETIFAQMANEEHPVSAWIVVGAGTGGAFGNGGAVYPLSSPPDPIVPLRSRSLCFPPSYERPRHMHGFRSFITDRGHRATSVRTVLSFRN